MKTAAHSRARKGGELGANGEWYEGGKFIATTDHAKKLGSNNHKATKKQQFESGQWAVPAEGKKALYPLLAGVEMIVWVDGKIAEFKFNDSLHGNYTNAEQIYERKAWIDLYNSGVRWIDVPTTIIP